MVTMSDPRRLGLPAMPDQNVLGPACQQQTMCCLFCPDSSHYSGQKIRVYALLTQKPLSQPVLTQNTLETMTNSFMALKNLKNHSQKPNSTRNKKSTRAHICFFMNF